MSRKGTLSKTREDIKVEKEREEKGAPLGRGMEIRRRFTTPGKDPLDQVKYVKRSSVINNPDGSVVFKMDDVEVPESWSQLATDILVSKYFRKMGVPSTGHETSARQVVFRIANTIRTAGEVLGGYFASQEDADAFEAELSYLLINQYAAFNSPVWFNCGLYHQYGIKGSGGNYYWDPKTDQILETEDSYSHPQSSACFIQSVEDDLMSIFTLAKNEAKLFKFGSGTGTNFSKLRGKQEKLSGGGTSSGLMSFLEVLDKGAGATKSGGITRRAAKMVCLDIDHPEIVDFINWKVKEEQKVAALIAAGYSADLNGEAYKTVSGQNSNNSVRIPDEFMYAYLNDKEWHTRFRIGGEICETFRARDLMRQIAHATWVCADPGVQFDTTINKWHTCKASGRINASNPCSEFMFIDDSSCNLASINLMKLYNPDTGIFDIETFKHIIRIFILAQEILVDFSSYPTEAIARNSHNFRPLGLGYTNMGALLMVCGLPYDSDEGRAFAAAITAIMTSTAYEVSSEIASKKGAFQEYPKNMQSMLEVIKMHRDAAYEIDEKKCPAYLIREARLAWDRAFAAGAKHGYRNAQVTVLAPTGTIGLLMDCDTTGIEPDYSLVKFKKLAGGGYFKIVNESIPTALRRLGYSETEIDDIVRYIRGSSSLKGAPFINEVSLKGKGFTDEEIERVEKALGSVFDISYAFTHHVIGTELFERLGIPPEKYTKEDFNLLSTLGFSDKEIEEANIYIAGKMTIEGAPHLKEEHLSIFDCANRCGKYGKRYLSPMAHIKMLAAVQKFISGAISKTINLPRDITEEEIEQLYVEAWRAGLKAVAFYRDGSKHAQPLNAVADQKKKLDSLPRQSVSIADPAQTAETSVLKRRRLPKKRRGFTIEARVGTQKIYLRTGEYDDGTLGEIFIDIAKEGATLRSLMNCFAIAVSLGLQYGVPLEEYVKMFTFTRFEPSGPVDHPNIKMATSIVDFIFRLLGMEYLGITEFAQVKPSEGELAINNIAPKDEGSGAKEKEAAEIEIKIPIQSAKTKNVKTTVPSQDRSDEDSDGESIIIAKRASSYVQPDGNIGVETALGGVVVKIPKSQASPQVGAASNSKYLKMIGGDAPLCSHCGNITIRNGNCYKCLNCGTSMGCS